MNPTRCAAVVGLCALALPAQELQELRYDLGKRLRRLERAWDAAPADGAARASATAAMQRAVRAFFGMDTRAAAQALDDGYLDLTDPGADDVARRLTSLGAAPSTRMVAPDGELRLTVAPAYRADDWPEGLRPWIRVGPGFGAEGGRALPVVRTLGGATFATEGDHVVTVTVAPGGPAEAPPDTAWVEVAAFQVSVVRDFAARIDALGDAARAIEAPALEAATLRGLARALAQLARGQAPETDLPAFRLTGEAEAVAAAAARGEPFYGDDRPGQFWLHVPLGRRALPVRMLVPDRGAPAREPRPLVLALHGAGGSENLFFDGYGDGAVVRLAEERGWYVCAPRAMPAGSAAALLEALASRFAIDRKRVYCVGHSMGAMTAVAAAQEFPDLFAKVAPLGGGGAVRDGEALAAVPFFVGAGEQDFALGGARALGRALARDGVEVELRIYPAVEHMLVVQAALPDVFAFFER